MGAISGTSVVEKVLNGGGDRTENSDSRDVPASLAARLAPKSSLTMASIVILIMKYKIGIKRCKTH